MSSIGNAVRAILRKLAAIALMPIEIVVDGIRQIIWRPRPLADQAMDVLDEEAPTATSAETRQARALTEGREAVRVQNAARELMKSSTISKRYLDPAFAGDARKIAWLGSLSQLQLGIVANADLRKLDAHLNGTKTLPMSLVTNFDDEPETPAAPARAQANAAANDRGAAVLMQLRKEARARAAR
ncbi:hypothetical protein [Aureimonas sp. AU40]|uniref:hypothetical protein n=1 Tax=Aureimonas sp. AU40 TaxID=1637747 RepID=UPI000785E876|nr:hypothetical protein [Aureimonas sp. AU40]